MPVGKAVELKAGSEIAVVGTGPAVNRALEAAEGFGERVAVYHFPFVKPLDTEVLESIASKFSKIVTVEDGALSGGLFGAVSEFLTRRGCKARIVPVGIGDEFVTQASQAQQRKDWGLDKESMEKIFQKFLEIPK